MIWIVSAISVIFFDVTYGLLIGFIFSMFTVLFRTQSGKARLFGVLENTDLYNELDRYESAKQVPGVLVFRYDASLYFANAENFREKIYELASSPSTLMEKSAKEDDRPLNRVIHHIIVDCSAWTFIDSVGIRVLKNVSNLVIKILQAYWKNS